MAKKSNLTSREGPFPKDVQKALSQPYDHKTLPLSALTPERQAPTQNASPVRNDFLQPGSLPFLIRREILDLLIDPKHNIDRECGYPEDITPLMYHLLYERDGIANRVVRLWPEESWALDPEVYEDEEENVQTDFEIAFTEILRRLNLWWNLERIDVLSGIGRFGVLLLGIDDGKPYSEPVTGLDERGLPVLNKKGKPVFNGTAFKPGDGHKLLFVRAFDETAVQVLQREVNPQNPRFGKPTRYLLTFRELDITEPAMLGTTAGGMATSQVHWTRIIHVADVREMSEIYGVPRMKPHFNRIVDIRKTMGGSAEMFWKGAFPGISFEMAPGVGVSDGEIDQEALRQELERYSGGLQRYLAVAGLTAKSLAPQISDPKGHVETQIDHICMGMGVPKRIFLGSERGELASTQDSKAWRMRVSRRRDKYVGPMLIREFINRCIDLGALPRPNLNQEGKTDNFEVYWPDLAVTTDAEKAQVALTKTQAMAAYTQGGVENLMPPMEYLTMIQDHNKEEAEGIVRAAEEWAGASLQQYPEEGQGNWGTVPTPYRQEGGNILPEMGQSQGDDYNSYTYQGPPIGDETEKLDIDTALSPEEVWNQALIENTWSDEARAAALEARRAHAQSHANLYNQHVQGGNAKPLHGDQMSAVNVQGSSKTVHEAILRQQGFQNTGGNSWQHANGTKASVSSMGVKYKSAPVSQEAKAKDKAAKTAERESKKVAKAREKDFKAKVKSQEQAAKGAAKEKVKAQKDKEKKAKDSARESHKQAQGRRRGLMESTHGLHQGTRIAERLIRPVERGEKEAERDEKKQEKQGRGHVQNVIRAGEDDDILKKEATWETPSMTGDFEKPLLATVAPPLVEPKKKGKKLNPKREISGTSGLFGKEHAPIDKVSRGDEPDPAQNPLMTDV